MKPEYEPKTNMQRLGYVVEECGEVLQAIGKTIRWGLESVNPELPPEQQESNAAWILRELDDLSGAIDRLKSAIKP
jgi:NTP pyrophosphatase (non-canonical NTP hydrolase)